MDRPVTQLVLFVNMQRFAKMHKGVNAAVKIIHGLKSVNCTSSSPEHEDAAQVSEGSDQLLSCECGLGLQRREVKG